jgi:hypothetical protein
MPSIAFLLVFLVLQNAPPACAQWTAAAYAGWAASFKSDVEVRNAGSQTAVMFDGIRFQSRSFQKPLYYGLRAGYMFRPQVGVEFEFIHLKVYADVDTPVQVSGTLNGANVNAPMMPSGVIQQLNVSHGVNLALANLVFRLPIRGTNAGPPRLSLTARFGAGPTLSHTEATVLGVSAAHYESGGAGIQAAGGAEVLLHRGLYALGEYKYTHTRQHLSVGPSAVEFPANSQHLVGGLGLRF